MKKLIISFMFVLGSYAPATYAQLTIDSCQTKARANYPLIKRYELIEKSKEYNLSNAGKGYLPQISLTARASYQSDVTKVPFSFPGIDVPTLSKDQYLATLDVTQTIWDGGSISSQKKITQAQSEVDYQQLNVDMYAIEERVNQLFFGILLFDAQWQQNEIMQEDLKRNHDMISSYIENGIANQADLDAVKVEQLKTKQTQAQIEANRKAYTEMLSAMIGESVGTLQKPGMETLVAPRAINRPELQLFDSQIQLFDSQRDMITAGYMPRLSVFMQGGYGKPGLNMLEDDFKPFYIGGVRLTWNFGALYTQRNDRQKVLINQNNVTTQKETFLYNINLEVTQENNDIKRIKDLMVYDDEIIQLRENVRKSAEIKVANGTLTVIELMREVNASNLAKQEKISHEIELLMTLYKLKNTTNN